MKTPKRTIEQEIRKVTQSIAYHGYDLVLAEKDILKAMQEYAELYHKEKLREDILDMFKWMEDLPGEELGNSDEYVTDKFLEYLKQKKKY